MLVLILAITMQLHCYNAYNTIMMLVLFCYSCTKKTCSYNAYNIIMMLAIIIVITVHYILLLSYNLIIVIILILNKTMPNIWF